MSEALFHFRRIAKTLRRLADIFESGNVESVQFEVTYDIEEVRPSPDNAKSYGYAVMLQPTGAQTIHIKLHLGRFIKPETKELINKAMR